jgi:hypothetical protein
MQINEYQENYVTGWIKLYRSIQNKGWYKKPDYVLLWVHILIKANHQGKEFWFNGENVKLKQGQFITGRKSLSSETGISESKIQRILKFFESEQQIEQQTSNANRLISVINYNQYQKSEQQIEQPVNNERTTSEQPVNTNKNEKKENNHKNVKKSIEERKNDFWQNLSSSFIDQYEVNLLKDFFDYWTEASPGARKMRFEKEKAFDVSRRLKTWLKNESKFGNKMDPDNKASDAVNWFNS